VELSIYLSIRELLRDEVHHVEFRLVLRDTIPVGAQCGYRWRGMELSIYLSIYLSMNCSGTMCPTQSFVWLAETRYCHHQYCMVYGMKGGGGSVGVAYIAQWSCDSITIG